jgi:hypothetical protein
VSLTINVAGRWAGTCKLPTTAPLDLGPTVDGWRLSWRLLGRPLKKTTRYGDTPLTYFVRGIEMSLSAVFLNWDNPELNLITAAASLLSPKGVNGFNLPKNGADVTDSAAEIVLSSTAGTPANANSFHTITFEGVSPDPDFPMDWDFGPAKQVYPFRGLVWPVDAGNGDSRFFLTG